MTPPDSDRPRIDLPPTPTDRKLALAGWLGVITHFMVVFVAYAHLPERIPVHFDFAGLPDRYGGRVHIWWLPVLGLALQAATPWLVRHPHTFNYPRSITPENAARQYRNATRMVRAVTILCLWAFVYITHATVCIALGEQAGLGPWFTPVFLVVVFGALSFFGFRAVCDA